MGIIETSLEDAKEWKQGNLCPSGCHLAREYPKQTLQEAYLHLDPLKMGREVTHNAEPQKSWQWAKALEEGTWMQSPWSHPKAGARRPEVSW